MAEINRNAPDSTLNSTLKKVQLTENAPASRERKEFDKQRVRILYILKLLLRKTDRGSSLTRRQITDELAKEGISVARGAFGSDMAALKGFLEEQGSNSEGGFTLDYGEGCAAGYKIKSRPFSEAELSLLSDLVLSCRSLSDGQAQSLIGKLGLLTNENGAAKLYETVSETLPEKCETSFPENREIYRNISLIRRAIAEKRKVKFSLAECDDKRNIVEKRVECAPLSLGIKNGVYYLSAVFDGDAKEYRLDRMRNLHIDSVCEKPPVPKAEKTAVRLRFENRFYADVREHFEKCGNNAAFLKDDSSHFLVKAEVEISDEFFAWLFTFGRGALITYPESVRGRYKDTLRAITDAQNYD